MPDSGDTVGVWWAAPLLLLQCPGVARKPSQRYALRDARRAAGHAGWAGTRAAARKMADSAVGGVEGHSRSLANDAIVHSLSGGWRPRRDRVGARRPRRRGTHRSARRLL